MAGDMENHSTHNTCSNEFETSTTDNSETFSEDEIKAAIALEKEIDCRFAIGARVMMNQAPVYPTGTVIGTVLQGVSRLVEVRWDNAYMTDGPCSVYLLERLP